MNSPWSSLMIFTLHMLYCGCEVARSPVRETRCIGLYDCIASTTCTDKHRDANSDALANRLIFRCGPPDADTVCCPVVDDPDRNKHRNRGLFDGNCSSAFGNRLFGGDDASLGQFPWMALIGVTSKEYSGVQYICGGSVINNRYILTAAHCVINVTKVHAVRLAEHDLRNFTDFEPTFTEVISVNATEVRSSRVHIHPDFNDMTLRNDVALIRLKTPIVFGEYIKPICLPFGMDDMAETEKQYLVAGWGLTGFASPRSNILQYASINSTDPEECDYLAPTRSLVARVDNSTQICASSISGGVACRGDSGGPLFMIYNNKYFVIGVVSFGLRMCDDIHSASVFTRVHPYLNWILDTVR